MAGRDDGAAGQGPRRLSSFDASGTAREAGPVRPGGPIFPDRIHRISTGSAWEHRIGYCRAVVAEGWVFVSGTTGTDHATGAIPERVEDQCALALAIIGRALTEAGASFGDVVRVRYILPRREDFEPCWPLLRATFGAHPPAATMIVAGLIDPRHRIEIEVDARLRPGATPPGPAIG